MKSLKVDIGPERIVLTDGVFPYLFRTSRSTLVLQAALWFPLNELRPKKYADGVPGYAISRDGSKTWQRWRAPLELGLGPFHEGAVTESNGTILVIDRTVSGPTPDGNFTGTLWESRDDFETVQGPISSTVHLPQARGDGFDDGGEPSSGVCFHRTLLKLPQGDLLATIYCWFKEDNTPCLYQPKMWKLRTVLLRSSDSGRHWHYVSTIAVDPKVGDEGFNEPVMIRLAQGARKGRLICLMRTGGHLCPIHQSVSDDEGATWSKPKKLGFCGVDPDLLEMSDGTLACSFGWRAYDKVNRTPFPEHGYYLAFSDDQGESWDYSTRLQYEPHSGVPRVNCYTSLCENEPGKLLMFYDTGTGVNPVRYIASREILVERKV